MVPQASPYFFPSTFISLPYVPPHAYLKGPEKSKLDHMNLCGPNVALLQILPKYF